MNFFSFCEVPWSAFFFASSSVEFVCLLRALFAESWNTNNMTTLKKYFQTGVTVSGYGLNVTSQAAWLERPGSLLWSSRGTVMTGQRWTLLVSWNTNNMTTLKKYFQTGVTVSGYGLNVTSQAAWLERPGSLLWSSRGTARPSLAPFVR